MRAPFMKGLAVAAASVLLFSGIASARDINAVTHLSLSASDTNVSRGDVVTLSGRLVTIHACQRNQRIELFQVGHPGNMLASTRTDGGGNYSFKRKMTRTTSFRTIFPGSAKGVHPDSTICQGSHSNGITVHVG